VPALALSENQELAPRASMSEIYDSIEQPRDDFFMSTGRVFFFCFCFWRWIFYSFILNNNNNNNNNNNDDDDDEEN